MSKSDVYQPFADAENRPVRNPEITQAFVPTPKGGGYQNCAGHEPESVLLHQSVLVKVQIWL
jgi:hypothetical protein